MLDDGGPEIILADETVIELKLQEKKNRETQEALERSWQQRETALKDREEELARLRKERDQARAERDHLARLLGRA